MFSHANKMRNTNALSVVLTIPLILDEIAASLSAYSLSQCTVVCSSWNTAFAPILWKDLLINNHQVVSLFQTSPAVQQGLRRNAGHVRAVNSIFCYPFLTLVTMGPFHNLTRVESLASELHNKGIVDHTNTQMLLLFIKANTSIREITLTNFPLSSVWTSVLLGNLIAGHPGLESVTINCFRGIQLLSVQHVLHGVALSSKVAKFSLICRSGGSFLQESTQTEADSGNVSLPSLPEGHVSGALKEVILDLVLHQPLNATLSSLVRHCPNLERLHIPSTKVDESFKELCDALRQCCQKLRHIEGGLLNPQDHHLAMLFSSSRNLKSYSMKSDQKMGPLSVKALLDDQRCFTLEQLDFKQCVAIKSKHIQLILTSCPNLKTFRALSGHDQQNSFDLRLDIRDLPIHSTKGPQWACQGLLELQIGFTGFSEITNDLPVQPYVDYIYDQLAVLTELQTLYLGGELGAAIFPDDSRVWTFDFTLRSGIWRLGTLKQLKHLDVQRLKHNRIGKLEVEWMVRHWPHLTEFHGQRKWQR